MVKPGYKQTEVGVIPEKWKDKKLGDVGKVCMCKRIFANQTSNTGEVPFFKIGTFGKEADAYISKGIYEDYKQRFSYPQKGDVLISAAGTLGRTIVFEGKDAYFQDSNIVWLATDKELLCNEYLYHYYKVIKWGASEGSTIARLYNGIICNTHIALPDVEEQKQIATVLSEIDELISLTEKQISKKKAIKQGAMQELLTGKRRLPGFSGEWRYFNLMKNSKVKARIGWQGLKKSEYLDSGYALLVTGTDFDDGRVLWDGCHYVTRSRYEQDRNIQLQNNDILITKDGSLGKAALVQGLTKPATLNSGIFVIRPLQDAYDPVFVYQILSSFVFKNFLDRLSAGSTIIHLYQKDVGKFEFLLPPTIAEQKAIAEALSEMDSDIAALENKLTKYRQVKQGMMQQLLTGKIRLKNDVEDLRQAEQANAVKTLPARTAHNRQFDDAVSIAAIVDTFYSDKYPLGRVKVQKLLYLLHRHQGVSVSDFKKKAAGPYADTVRYKGGEPIAKKNKYIVSESGKQGTRYSKGTNMGQALDYVERWGMQADLQWLKENFLHTSRNDLELFATVDMAMCDLDEVGISVSVESIKNLIASNKEWKAKLSKTYFSDWDIARAIKKCTELFN
jgi:type I restriction enzyme S subunit